MSEALRGFLQHVFTTRCSYGNEYASGNLAALASTSQILLFALTCFTEQTEGGVRPMMEHSKICTHFGGIGDCYCNNDSDNPGECVYENGIEPNNPAALCKYYYHTAKPIVNRGDILSNQK